MQIKRNAYWKAFRKLFMMLPLVLCYTAKAQQFNFQPVQDGPTAASYKVIQDKHGYIWIACDNGIWEYDKSRFRSFSYDSAGNKITGVIHILEDGKGRIVFCTTSGHIGYIYNDHVVFPALNKKLQAVLKNGNGIVFDMYVDHNHILWLATYYGLYRTIKPDDYSNIEMVPPPSESDSCNIGITVVDDQKALCAGYYAVIPSVDKGNGRLYMFIKRGSNVKVLPYYSKIKKEIAPYCITTILSNHNTVFFIMNKLYVVYSNGKDKVEDDTNHVINFYEDREGGLWVGTMNGLEYFNDINMDSRPILSLKGYSITSIIEDSENGFWVSTLNGQVFYLNSKYSINYDNIHGMDDNISLMRNVAGKVLVSDSKNYLRVIKGDSVYKLPLPVDENVETVHDCFVWHNKFFLACTAGVLESDTRLEGNWKTLYNGKYKTSFLVYNLSSYSGKGFYGINYDRLVSINNDSIEVGALLPARGQAMQVMPDGDLLVGCTNGLYIYQKGKYIYLGSNSKFLSSSISVIKTDKGGNIWVGTKDQGIGIFRNHAMILIKSKQDGLASNFVNDIDFDSSDNVWVATDNGLSKIVPSKNYMIESYGLQNGLISKEVNTLAINGQYLWVGTRKGVIKIDIKHFGKNEVPPPVYIVRIKVNDSIIDNPTDLSNKERNLSFSLVGLTFKDSKQRYAYRLLSIDTTWHYTDLSEVSFNNLSPGRYRFEAKAVNADGVASVVPATYSFIIESPFWLRWWFILCEVFVVAALVYLFIKYRLHLIQKKEAEKTRINKMLAEYQMTALTAQMNPHFVFNAINSIQDYVLGNDTQKAYDYLTKFSQLVRIILYNAKEKTITLEKELESLKMYVELEELRFEGKFQFIFEVGKEVDVYGIQLPSMIIQPYVENAIWHGLMPLGGKRKGILKVNITQQGNLLKIVIEDNGIGREESRKIRKSTGYKSVGMEITRDRINVLNNLLGAGESEINIYDLYDEQVKPAGTRVEIKITVNKD